MRQLSAAARAAADRFRPGAANFRNSRKALIFPLLQLRQTAEHRDR